MPSRVFGWHLGYLGMVIALSDFLRRGILDDRRRPVRLATDDMTSVATGALDDNRRNVLAASMSKASAVQANSPLCNVYDIGWPADTAHGKAKA